MAITKSSFGITNDGEEAFLYRLENTSGAYVTITSFGCRIVSICVPDREGELRDVCLGYDTLAEYEKDTASFGAVVGRHANRIEKGVFILNDKTYHLAVNQWTKPSARWYPWFPLLQLGIRTIRQFCSFYPCITGR